MSGGKLRGFDLRGLELWQNFMPNKKAPSMQLIKEMLFGLVTQIFSNVANVASEARLKQKQLNDLPGLEIKK